MDGMTYDPPTVRFIEQTNYDVMADCHKTRFQAITAFGSFFTEVECEKAAKKREARKAFQEYVFNAMELGRAPHEVVNE